MKNIANFSGVVAKVTGAKSAPNTPITPQLGDSGEDVAVVVAEGVLCVVPHLMGVIVGVQGVIPVIPTPHPLPHLT